MSPAPRTLREARFYRAAISRSTALLRKQPALLELNANLPTLVIPDIHGRTDYLTKVLAQKGPKRRATYGQLLRRGQLQVVLLGDGMHAESRGERRWAEAERNPKGAAMAAEAGESLGTMKQIMDFMAAYPGRFHYLKGNHDNIMARNRGGDWALKKYTEMGETHLLRNYLKKRLGSAFLREYAAFERSLPLMAVGSGLVLSHSRPAKALARRKILQRNGETVHNFTWTSSKPPRSVVDRQLRLLEAMGATYMAGHQSTGAKPYRRSGRLIEMNSEEHMYYAIFAPGRPFDPDHDIRDAL